MPYPELDSERMQLLGVIHADTGVAGTTYRITPYIDMALHHKAFVLISCGDMAALATLDVQLLQALDAAGAGAKIIAGKGIAQLQQAVGDGDDAVCINLRTEEMDIANDYTHISVRVRPLTQNVNFCVFVLGNDPRYAPVSQAAWTEVVQ